MYPLPSLTFIASDWLYLEVSYRYIWTLSSYKIFLPFLRVPHSGGFSLGLYDVVLYLELVVG